LEQLIREDQDFLRVYNKHQELDKNWHGPHGRPGSEPAEERKTLGERPTGTYDGCQGLLINR
jgi:hypothetical protein